MSEYQERHGGGPAPGRDESGVFGREAGASGVGVDPTDLWVLAGLIGRVPYASYLTVRTHAAQYRLIVDVLLAAQSRSLTGTAGEDVGGLLEVELRRRGLDASVLLDGDFNLQARLDQLVDWEVLESWQARAETEADFLRNRQRYQLTPGAARLHRFIVEVADATGEESTTALLAPPVLAARLDAMVEALTPAGALLDPDALAEADRNWAQVQTTIRDMATAAGTWQNRMASALAGAPSEEKLSTLRQTIIHYVEQWGSALDVHTPRIADALTQLRTGSGVFEALARSRQGAEVANDVVARTVTESRSTFEALSAWFGGADCDARRLRRQVRDAVTDLLRAQRALLVAGTAISRRREMLAVAEAVQAAPSDTAAWECWTTVTGLFGARHLSLTRGDDTVDGPRTSFWDAAPAPVEIRLRAHGARARAGRAARAVDRSAARRAARKAAEERRLCYEEAARGITKRSGLALSQWGPLSGPEAELFMSLLSAARRSSADDNGVRDACSADGRWSLSLRPVPGVSSAVIELPQGFLVCDEAILTVGAR